MQEYVIEESDVGSPSAQVFGYENWENVAGVSY
jgi:hypothetical protein